MIKLLNTFIDRFFEFNQIDDHAVFIQFFSANSDFDFPVVPMNACTNAGVIY